MSIEFEAMMRAARGRIDELELREDDLNEARAKYDEAVAAQEALDVLDDHEDEDEAVGDTWLVYEAAQKAFTWDDEEELKTLRAQVGVGEGL